ncbi:AAA family ATPase [archaeon]|jgi:dephospho-CoA kinase|nr:AAA family ATPase [archaeon]MBT4373419.1 AAA family ATPase [archaeon]MBT4531867.1 AAA family ATPase [archaeon]MBT7001534.1 AAA family ATPase [archaeon]MBT7282574.1 AAA family ATPase [archaeon]
MIIGITGTLGAGKGTIVDYLKTKGFVHYSVRDFIVDEIKILSLAVNRDNMVLVANKLRAENSPSYIVEKLYESAREDGGLAVIESLRAVGEVEALQSKGKFYLLAVDAEIRKRYERILLRQSKTDNVSFQEFVVNEKREMISNDPAKQNISQCINKADFVFENNGSFEDLEKKVEEVLQDIL